MATFDKIAGNNSLNFFAPRLPPKINILKGPFLPLNLSAGSVTLYKFSRIGLPTTIEFLRLFLNPRNIFFAIKANNLLDNPGIAFCSCMIIFTPINFPAIAIGKHT